LNPPPKADLARIALNGCFVRTEDVNASYSESLVPAPRVELCMAEQSDRFSIYLIIVVNGPKPPLVTNSYCCGAARRTGHSLRVQEIGDFR
jgi:hypothetical protein